MKIIWGLLSLLITFTAMAQKTDTLLIDNLLRKNEALFSSILNHPQKNQVQVLYTQVNRDHNNKPSFKSYSYNLDDRRYFYPASTVKLAAVIFALEKINELKIKGLTPESSMFTDSAFKEQTNVIKDASAPKGQPSVAHYIKKILLTSDNDAFNRLFEFIGRAEINAKLKKYGLLNSRILNRLAIGDAGESTRHTNPIRFYNGENLVYHQSAQYDSSDYPLTLSNTIMGIGYVDNEEKLISEPFSLKNKNTFCISDQQSLMKRLVFPEAFPAEARFNLTRTDCNLIYQYMSELPNESDFPKSNQNQFWPTYTKMLYYGREKGVNPDSNIRIFNKYGDSYGFIIDNSYFVDFKNKIEFLLVAVVQSNENGIYNDGDYEYETVCYPFMKNLGKLIYDYEIHRKRENDPNLSKYRFKY